MRHYRSRSRSNDKKKAKEFVSPQTKVEIDARIPIDSKVPNVPKPDVRKQDEETKGESQKSAQSPS